MQQAKKKLCIDRRKNSAASKEKNYAGSEKIMHRAKKQRKKICSKREKNYAASAGKKYAL